MGFAPFGVYWRNLRRILATHLLSRRRTVGFGEFWRTIGLKIVGEFRPLMEKKGEVKVKKLKSVAFWVFEQHDDERVWKELWLWRRVD